MTVSEARETLPEIINRAVYGKERVIVSRHGKEVVAVISAEDLHRLEQLEREAQDRQDLVDARAALREAKQKGTKKLADLRKVSE